METIDWPLKYNIGYKNEKKFCAEEIMTNERTFVISLLVLVQVKQTRNSLFVIGEKK